MEHHVAGGFERFCFQEFEDDPFGDTSKQLQALAGDYGVNAESPFVDEVEPGECGDEARASNKYLVPGLLFECGDFLFKVPGGEPGVVPVHTFDGAGEKNFRDVFDRIGEVVHVFIAGGIFNDCGPEVLHELVRDSAVQYGAGMVEHFGVIVMQLGVGNARGVIAEAVEGYVHGGDYVAHSEFLWWRI